MQDFIKFEYGVKTPVNQMLPKHIYLDGAGQGGPRIDNQNKVYNFDHHEDCLRMVTLSTCQQVLIARELGFNPDQLSIVINDLDADTILAVWALLVPLNILKQPRVKQLIHAVGFVDAHGPAVPGHPVHQLHRMLGASHTETQNIQLLYKKLDLLDNWYDGKDIGLSTVTPNKPVQAWGINSLNHIVALGEINGFEDIYATCTVGIIAVPGSDNTIGWTIGKLSDFVDYDIPAFLDRCNQLEPGWGGGSTIGGAPRLEGGKRSSLTIDQITTLLLAQTSNATVGSGA